VRDALSLLDQAMVQAERGQVVPAEVVRDMLGLADRALTIALFEQVMRGAAAEALMSFRELYRLGADPVVVMLDLLEHAHGATVAKTLGPEALALPKDQAARLAAVGAEASAGSLARIWQMLLKAHDDTTLTRRTWPMQHSLAKERKTMHGVGGVGTGGQETPQRGIFVVPPESKRAPNVEKKNHAPHKKDARKNQNDARKNQKKAT
jgi:DNA polymerase III gamma/tau subunit